MIDWFSQLDVPEVARALLRFSEASQAPAIATHCSKSRIVDTCQSRLSGEVLVHPFVGDLTN